ncbi:polysaccharide biosynthesis C-terminal domain-containing protein [Marinifilum flexuosum]|uniref:polysaccharide biosynthesis C-terminal domain-containing protein n=1 Tax=Marinifilum flexuosum TaxID=1117708 RepID=UPI002495A243|nr:polysaccharide biosynthesis C-terminal domain-containing protein [Marinifilum flexuosum]
MGVIDWQLAISLFLFVTLYGLFNSEINYLRILQKFDRVVYLYIFQMIVAIMGLVLFNNGLNFKGVLLIVALSHLCAILFFKLEARHRVLKNIKVDLIKENIDCLKYAIPITIIALANFTLSSMDQFFLKFYGFEHELSGYIANYNIAEKSVVFVLSVISLVFIPSVFKKYNKLTKDVYKDIGRAVGIFSAISLVVVGILFLVKDWLVIIFTDIEYVEYSWLIPFIAFGGVFLGINSIISEVFTVAKNTLMLMYCYISGFILNFILNFVFIPNYGIKGAVITTICSYLGMMLITLYRIKVEYNRIKNYEV